MSWKARLEGWTEAQADGRQEGRAGRLAGRRKSESRSEGEAGRSNGDASPRAIGRQSWNDELPMRVGETIEGQGQKTGAEAQAEDQSEAELEGWLETQVRRLAGR